MNFRQFEALYWIARLGSFHAAARHLHTSQPAISARIREMEQQLGVTLCDRSERKVRPTPKGHEMLRYAAQVMVIAAEIQQRVGTREALTGRVRLGVPSISALTWLPHLLRRVARTVLGEITSDNVRVTAMHPDQRCTIASVAGHSMYERSNPFYEYVAGGRLDMTNRHYEQVDPGTTRITGPTFEPAPEFRVKLEGSGKVGERYVGLVGIRDPYSVKNVDGMIDWAHQQVRERFGNAQYELHYTVYGRDGVMGAMEPNRDRPAHELAVLVQGIAPTQEMAEEVALIGTRQMFYARLPDVKGTAGSVAFPLDEVMRASPAYRWTVNHTYAVRDGLTLHDTHLETVGA
jgi:molybdenum-dependent DNA-binding transcriptional regulator ModE